jgi:hypothetical protein
MWFEVTVVVSPNCRWVHLWPCVKVLCTSAWLFCYFSAVTVYWCWGNNSKWFCAFVNWAAICHYLNDFKWVWAPPVLVVKFTLSGLRRRSFSIRKMLPLCYNNAWSALKYHLWREIRRYNTLEWIFRWLDWVGCNRYSRLLQIEPF